MIVHCTKNEPEMLHSYSNYNLSRHALTIFSFAGGGPVTEKIILHFV